MRHKIISSLIGGLGILITTGLYAQGNGAGLNNNNVVGWNNVPTSLVNEKISYSDVKGNCFWKDEWLPVKIFMNNGTIVKLPKAKLNFYANSVHYLNDKGNELAAQGGIKAVVFYSPFDTARVGVFKLLSGSVTEGREYFAQVLADGNISFLKVIQIKLAKQEADPMLKTIEWIFEPKELYFIQDKGALQELKSLNKKHLFSAVEYRSQDEGWLKMQKNNLRNERDIISFLIYRNTPGN
ncbi:MAG: hypothetical protein JST69_10035 [Bacteroidetes bacterium]|nr:hypothetical protein [Bacteroidota bacterium]